MKTVQQIIKQHPKAYKELKVYMHHKVAFNEMPLFIVNELGNKECIEDPVDWPEQMIQGYLIEFLHQKGYELASANLRPERIRAVILTAFKDLDFNLNQSPE